MATLFTNRKDAGRQLSSHLTAYLNRSDTIVLGCPNNGVPVATEIAQFLQLDMDIELVCNVNSAHDPNLIVGCIAYPDISIIMEHRLSNESTLNLSTMIAEKKAFIDELNRRLRHGRPATSLTGKTVILTDDGALTGQTLYSALTALLHMGPTRIIVALPVATHEAVTLLKIKADEVITLHTRHDLSNLAEVYQEYTAISDDQVIHLLSEFDRGVRMKERA